MLAVLVTAANMHDLQPMGALPALAAGDGIYVGPRMATAATDYGADAQVTTREVAVTGFSPLPPRWRIEATFGTLGNRRHVGS